MIYLNTHYEKIKHKKYKYRLVQDVIVFVGIFAQDIKTEYFHLHRDGTLTIFKGYVWDGCSGPTWDTKNTMQAGLVHDCGYQALREDLLLKYDRYAPNIELYREEWEVYRERIDQLFLDFLIFDGMSYFRYSYYHWGVRTFGAKHAMPEFLKDAS